MKEFRITLSNHPGELAHIAEALSHKGVNLRSIAASAEGNLVTVHLIGHDVDATRSGLESVGAKFKEQEILQLILEDKAGELANVAAKLSAANVNIDAIYLTGRADDMVEIAVAVDDIKKAKQLFT